MYRPGARPLDGEAPVLVGVVVPVELPLSALGLVRHRDYAGFGCRLLVGVQDHAFDLTAGPESTVSLARSLLARRSYPSPEYLCHPVPQTRRSRSRKPYTLSS